MVQRGAALPSRVASQHAQLPALGGGAQALPSTGRGWGAAPRKWSRQRRPHGTGSRFGTLSALGPLHAPSQGAPHWLRAGGPLRLALCLGASVVVHQALGLLGVAGAEVLQRVRGEGHGGGGRPGGAGGQRHGGGGLRRAGPGQGRAAPQGRRFRKWAWQAALPPGCEGASKNWPAPGQAATAAANGTAVAAAGTASTGGCAAPACRPTCAFSTHTNSLRAWVARGGGQRVRVVAGSGPRTA